MSAPSLKQRLQTVQRRWWMVGIVAGLAWALAAAILMVLFGGWLDLLWELSPAGRMIVLAISGTASIVFFGVWIWRTGQQGRFTSMARRIDRAMGFGGEVLTGWELDQNLRQSEGSLLSKQGTLTVDMARMAVDHAASVAEKVQPAQAVSAKPASRSALFLAVLLAIVTVLTAVMPTLARTQWNRFVNPFGDVPPYSKITFEVEPGTTDVLYGQPLDIRAAIRGEPVDAAELVLEDESGRVETLPMFPEPDSRWRASLAKITSSATYSIRAYRARSEKFQIRVITVPQIENVRFCVIPPAYTNLAAYQGPLPKGGIAGLPGTTVQVWATSNRPLSGGTLAVTASASKTPDGEKAPTLRHAMKPTSGTGSEVFGEFTITGDGKFDLQLADVNERTSQQRFSGGITLLNDERPMVRIVNPPERSLATPEAILPVEVSAEDDYGIAHLEIYRSLNESRPLSMEIPLPKRSPRRFKEKVNLPLAAFGLKPGDVLQFFARVQDTDPKVAKGSESTVVTVEIISQEDFEEMIRMRDGVELMLSRYREAQRRLESAAEEIEKLSKKLESQNPDDPASEETKRELQQLVKRMKEDSAALKKRSQSKLPYNLDEKLSPHLGKIGQLSEDAAKAIEQMLEESKMHNKALGKKLNEVGKQLAGERKAYEEETMLPVEILAAIVPLSADQERFIMLVAHQRDLAERLASFKGHDREDNPAMKARMRELEEEQRSVRETLNELLNDIEEHVKKLPEDERLNKLRDTATSFVEKVRESGAASVMADAEAGLAEFSGTIGHKKAKEAAEILEEFLKKKEQMGNCASDCLDFSFDPSMSSSMKITLSEMLSEMGFNPGSGKGRGRNGRFGQGMGLFGGLPSTGQLSPIGGGRGSFPKSGKGGTYSGSDPDDHSPYATMNEGNVEGGGEGHIPLRYRRHVGQYFQRIAEETKEK